MSPFFDFSGRRDYNYKTILAKDLFRLRICLITYGL
jgi:hypothetical protein